MKINKTIFWLILIFHFLTILKVNGRSKQKTKFLFRSIRSVTFSDLANVSVKLTRLKSGIKVLDLDLFVYKNLDNNVHNTIEIFKELSDNPNASDYKLMDRQVLDICAHARGTQKYFFWTAIMGNLAQYGNLSNFCPLYTGYYYTKGFNPEGHAAAVMVSLFAQGYYRIISNFHLGKTKSTRKDLFKITSDIQS